MAGIFCLASLIKLVSIVAEIKSSLALASAIISPQGLIISECPKVFLPFLWFPHWAAAKTKHPFSIALALVRECQWLIPVV